MSTSRRHLEQRVEALFDALAVGGARHYFGESVSQLEHALQTAYFARASQASDALVAAALLHDVGHVVEPGDANAVTDLGVVAHAKSGATYLRSLGFREEVAALVAGHVDAKRYLVAKKPAYARRLSVASTRTLALQGGPMSKAEAEAFEKSAVFADLLRVRQWDERAKDPELSVPSLDTYRNLLMAELRSRFNCRSSKSNAIAPSSISGAGA